MRITHLTTRDGLPGNQVIELQEDQYGQLWIATQSGLCYYDGSRVHQPGSGTVAGIEPKKFRFDVKGRLWVGIPDGIVQWDGRSFDTFPLPDDIRPLLVGYPDGFEIYGDTTVMLPNEGRVLVNGHWIPGLNNTPGAPDMKGMFCEIHPVTREYYLYDSLGGQLVVYTPNWEEKRVVTGSRSYLDHRHQLVWKNYARGPKYVIVVRGPLFEAYDLTLIDPITSQKVRFAKFDPDGTLFVNHPSAPDVCFIQREGGGAHQLYLRDGMQYQLIADQLPSSTRRILLTAGGEIALCSDKGVHIIDPGLSIRERLQEPDKTGKSRILITMVDGDPVPFARQPDHEAAISGSEVEIKAHLAGFQTGLMVPEYQLNGGTWTAFESGQLIRIEGLRSGRNVVLFRARSVVEEDIASETSSLVVMAELPILQQFGFRLWGGILFTGLLGMMIWSGLARGRQRREVRQLRQELYRNQLRTIQSQLNPHFLFNAMVGLQNTIRNGTAEQASEQLLQLAKLIRKVLELSQRPDDTGDLRHMMVPLQQELQLLHDYVELENRQRSPRFHFELRVDPGLEQDSPLVPPLLIQPFVENAIIHGISIVDDGRISVDVSREGRSIIYQIQDNGIGREAAIARKAGRVEAFRSLGGTILRQRIALLRSLGLPTELAVSDAPGGGTLVRIQIPESI